MNKEDARAVLNVFLSRNHLELVTDVKAYVLKIVESIEPEYEKVVLPKAVGEQWDKLVRGEKDSGKATKVDDALYQLSHYALIDRLDTRLLFNWWKNTPGSYSALIDASKYGWVPKSEKLYRVRVPETQTSYYYKGSDRHVHASDTSGGHDNEFSEYELQQYGLDGERFTKEEVTDDEQ